MEMMKKRWIQLKDMKQGNIIIVSILISLTILLGIQLVLSLRWRMVHDVPQMHYMAFLIDRFNYVPYKDFFVPSLPGTFFFHLFIGKLFGYGDFAIRCVDIAWLLLLSGFTWLILKRFGKYVAWAGIVLFGLSYLQLGQTMCLQRDYIGILPIVVAIYIGTSDIRLKRWFQIFLIGILFGLSAIIKPHSSIGLPIVVVYMSINRFKQLKKGSVRSFISIIFKDGLSTFAGYVIPLFISFCWLWFQGALPYFREMAFTYLRLHLELAGSHEIIIGRARISYLLLSYVKLGGLTIWLVPASLGLYMALFENEGITKAKRFIILLMAMIFAYSIYPVFAGQFWTYHWLPFQYFIVITAGFIFIPFQDQTRATSKRTFQVVVIIVTVFVSLQPLLWSCFREIRGRTLTFPRVERADEIAQYLKSQLKPGDSVQPLDWTGGAHQALLMAEAKLATPYIYDYYFYHHISHPYIQLIRKRFIDALYREKPRFIIDILIKPRVKGKDTTDEFPALQSFIQDYYQSVKKGDGYIIFERKLLKCP